MHLFACFNLTQLDRDSGWALKVCGFLEHLKLPFRFVYTQLRITINSSPKYEIFLHIVMPKAGLILLEIAFYMNKGKTWSEVML
jgi:hypothetical protein